jgi:NitT/TauT family transport system permease protein
LWVSLQEFAWGFLFAVLVGVGLGFLMARFKRVDRALGPTVWAIYAVPREAFIPLLLVWFGIGLNAKIAVVFLGAVFPLIANTYLGATSVDPVTVRAARAFCANGREMLAKVVLPSTLPYLIDGLRLGAGRGLIGVVVAEMYVSREGIGYLLMQAAQNFRTPQLIFEVLLVATVGILISQLLLYLERRFASWRSARVELA